MRWLVGALLLCLLGTGGAHAGMSISCHQMPAGYTQPADAAAQGYNCLRIDIPPLLSAVDLNDTRDPGYSWYNHGKFPNMTAGVWCRGTTPNFWNPAGAPVPSSAWHQNSGTVTYDGISAQAVGAVTVADQTASPNGYVGIPAVDYGFYFDVSASYANTGPATTNGNTPAFFAEPIELLTGTVSSSTRTTEFDFQEAQYNGSGVAVGAGQSEFEIDCLDQSTWHQSTNWLVTYPGSPNFSQLHTYGELTVPMAKNSGTGLVKHYFDGTHLTSQCTGGCDFSYTATGAPSPGMTNSPPNGTFSVADSYHFVFIMNALPQWPMTYQFLRVWTP